MVTGVYIIFFISAQKLRMWVRVRTASPKYEEYQIFFLKIFNFLVVKFSVYLTRRVFVMEEYISSSVAIKPVFGHVK